MCEATFFDQKNAKTEKIILCEKIIFEKIIFEFLLAFFDGPPLAKPYIYVKNGKVIILYIG